MFHRIALSTALLAISMTATLAQPTDTIWVPSDAINYDRKLNDDGIVICLNAASALVEMDRQIGQLIADSLLINVVFTELVSPFPAYAYDFRIPFASTDLYVQVTNHCNALMGVRLSPGQMPEWMTVSAPYYETRQVLATTDAALTGFDAIPPGHDIGSRLGGPGDIQLTAHLRSLSPETRPRRIPYPNNELLLQKLADASLSTVFIWEPVLYLASDGDPSSLGIQNIFAPPFAVPSVEFAVAFPIQDTYMRGLFDEAISTLRESGEIEAIVNTFSVPTFGE